jgi:putative ABC transport system permease protein
MRPGKIGLRKVLSVSQFVISFFFIATSLLIFSQFRHYLEFEYGFNTKNIVNIELQGVPYQKLANALRAVPGVSQISACDVIPATGTSNTIPLKQKGSKEVVKQLTIIHADENFVGNLGIRLVAGKNLPEAGASSGRFVLVNRSAVKELGYGSPAQMLGQELGSEWSDEALEVIGVTEDFQTRVLLTQHKPGPLVIRNQPADFKYLNVKIASPDLLGTVAELEGQWKAVDPLHPFRYEFYDRELAATHQGVFDVVSILGFIAFLAVVISCLGLLGMATYTAERRRKEVGIRKVLGAEALGLAFLLSREFLIVLAISVAIAAPLSYVLNNFWLQNLSHRVNFGFGTLLASALILLIPGLLTIGSQTFRVARSKPVDSLRME